MKPDNQSDFGPESNNKGMVIAIAAVIALVVGGGAGYAIGSMKTSSSDTAMKTSSPSPAMAGESDGVTVGGAKMVANKDIVDNAVEAKNVTTVVSLVKLADLVETLKGTGPFTVFAPNNDAFAKLPAATVKSLQEPANVGTLKKILTYHVVSGTYTSADLRAMAAKGATLTSVQGEMLTPVMVDNKVQIKDMQGNSVAIQTADVISSNGVTHVIESVLMP